MHVILGVCLSDVFQFWRIRNIAGYVKLPVFLIEFTHKGTNLLGVRRTSVQATQNLMTALDVELCLLFLKCILYVTRIIGKLL